MQHLFGEPLAHLVLEPPAVGEQRRQALVARQAEEPRLAQQQSQRPHDRPARRGDHVGHVQIQPAGALAARRRNQTERAAVAQQARRHAGLPQQPLHPAVGRHLQAAGATRDAVEVLAGIEHPDQKLPGRRVRPGVALPHREVRTQHLSAFVQRGLQLRRDRAVAGPGIPLRREVPAEHRRGERPEVRQPRFRLAVGMEPAFVGARAQQPLAFRVVRKNRAGADQGRRRHHEAGRPDEADPLQVGVDVRVAFRHRLHRYA